MIYIRGHARDYDHWAADRTRGLVLCRRAALFQARRERRAAATTFMAARAAACRQGHANRSVPRLHRRRRRGRLSANAGFQRRQQEGFGPYQLTIRRRPRWSAASAISIPLLTRPNLKIESGAMAPDLLEGKRAIGVDHAVTVNAIQRGRSRSHLSRWRSEFAATAELSGIGRADLLKRPSAWPRVVDLPGRRQESAGSHPRPVSPMRANRRRAIPTDACASIA